jgi:hypothetical protein
MSFDHIAYSQTIRNTVSVPKSEKFLEPIASSSDIVRTGMHIASIPHGLPQAIHIMTSYSFGICQDLRYSLWYSHLVDSQVRVRRDDCAPGKVDTLSRQVSSKSTLFAFEPLHEASYGFLARLRGYTGEFRVNVHGYRELQEFPVLLQQRKSETWVIPQNLIRTMNWAVGKPFVRLCLISALEKTISASFTVRSSSLDAPSWATEGRIQTGGTEIYCQIYSSGRPKEGRSPNSSQS